MSIGIDLININRLNKIVDRTPNFCWYCFTENEIAYAYSYNDIFSRLTGLLAAKEAVAYSTHLLPYGVSKRLVLI